MNQLKLPRLLAAAKEFNIGQDTLIEFLVKKKIDRDNLKPTARITEEMYLLLQSEFSREESDKLIASIKLHEYENNYVKFDSTIFSLENKLIECIKANDTEIDLGNFGLQDRDFEENSILNLFFTRYNHLEIIILSSSWLDINDGFKESDNIGTSNKLNEIPKCFRYQKKLRKLIIAGTRNNKWGISDLSILSDIKSLKHLDLSNNALFKINHIENLSELEFLNLANCNLENINGVSKNEKLKFLNFSLNSLRKIVY